MGPKTCRLTIKETCMNLLKNVRTSLSLHSLFRQVLPSTITNFMPIVFSSTQAREVRHTSTTIFQRGNFHAKYLSASDSYSSENYSESCSGNARYATTTEDRKSSRKRQIEHADSDFELINYIDIDANAKRIKPPAQYDISF